MIKDSMWLRDLCFKNNFDYSVEQINKIDKYVNLLLSWNQKINLVSRHNTEDIWCQHILASITLLFKFQFFKNCSIIDIGTGGGLPGIPLAVLCLSNSFLLIDSIQKKINVVKNIVEELGLQNVKVESGRAEDLSKRKEYRNKFDYTITRAVSSIENVVRWSKPFLKNIIPENENQKTGKLLIPKGTILLLKGGELSDEIRKTQIKLKPQLIQSHPIIIDGIDPNELVDKKIIIIKP